MRIGLSYDLKSSLPIEETGSDDTFEEYDSPVTVQIISDAIAAGKISVLGVPVDLKETVGNISAWIKDEFSSQAMPIFFGALERFIS
jgi:hypothetical protein